MFDHLIVYTCAFQQISASVTRPWFVIEVPLGLEQGVPDATDFIHHVNSEQNENSVVTKTFTKTLTYFVTGGDKYRGGHINTHPQPNQTYQLVYVMILVGHFYHIIT